MTYIDLNRIKGNFGSSYVTFRLSRYCLVRQVTEGTDIGIDLYCESFFKNSKPFLHFWVQVKTGESIKMYKDNSSAGYTFDINHLNYWKRQPVPVYVFIVPVDWPPPNNNIKVFVINITDYLLKNEIPSKKKRITIKSNLILRNENDYREFVNNNIPQITAAQSISKGYVSMVPTYEPEYIYTVPTGYSVMFLKRILWQLRTTAGVAILDLFNTKSELKDESNHLEILTNILEAYSEDKHWEVHRSLGLAYLMVNNYKKAKESFQRSLNMIESDPKINQNDWSHNKRMLRDYIKDCEKNLKK